MLSKNLAKDLLRYLDNGEEVKVGIAEQQEQLDVLVQIGTRRCQDRSQETRMLNQRQEFFFNAIEGKLKMESRANKRLHDQIIEETKKMEHMKIEEALNLM